MWMSDPLASIGDGSLFEHFLENLFCLPVTACDVFAEQNVFSEDQYSEAI